MSEAVDTLFADVVARLDQRSFADIAQQVEQAGEAAGRKGGGKLSSAFGSLIGGLPALAATAAAAVGAALVGGATAALNIAQQAQQGVRDIQAELGVTTAEAEKLGEAAKQVFSSNWGESLTDAQSMVVEVRKQIKGLSDEELPGVTSAVAAISDTFKTDLGGTASAVNSLMKDMGLTSQQALDFISKGLQDGLNNSGDFLETITEYSTQFKNGGASAEEFYSILKTGSQGGVLGTDKVADSFKEFVVRIQDGSKTTSAGLAQLGIDQKKLLADLGSGGITAADAYNLVLDRLRATKDSNTQMQAGVALLGTQFEDLGKSGALAISGTAVKMKDLAGATDQVSQRYNTLPQLMQGTWRQVLLQLEPLGKELLILANDAMPAVKTAINQLGPIVSSIVRFLVDGFQRGREAVVQFGPQINTMINTVKPVVLSLGPLFAAVFGTVRALWDTVLHPTLRAILPVAQLVFNGAAAVVRASIQIITGILNAVTALLRGDVSGALNAIKSAFNNAGETMGRAMQAAGTAIITALRNVVPRMAEIAQDIVRGLIRGIENGVGAVAQAARNLATGVIDNVKKALNIQSPSRVMAEMGKYVSEGLADGITKTSPTAQKAAAKLGKDTADAARKALEQDIKFDAWKKALDAMTVAQLESAQATARAAGDRAKYNAVTAELAQREKAAEAATRKASDAAQAAARQLADNRRQIEQGEQMERYVAGLASATSAQLAHAREVAKARGEVDKYNAIKAEQERREKAVQDAQDRATGAAKKAAEQLKQNRKAIEDALKFDAYVTGLRDLTDAQLASEASAARAAGEQTRFNAVLAEQKSRADEAAQAVSDLVDIQIKEAQGAYQRNPEGAADAAMRNMFGAGDQGLITALSGLTGRTTAQVRADVEGAIAELTKLNKNASDVLLRVYSEAIQHRREAAAASVKTAQESAKAETDAYQQRVQSAINSIQALSDEGLITLYDEARATRDQQLLKAVYGEFERRAKSTTDALEAGAKAGEDALNRLSASMLDARDLMGKVAPPPDTAKNYAELSSRIIELKDDLKKDGTSDAWVASIEDMGKHGELTATQVKNLKLQIAELFEFVNLNRPKHGAEPLVIVEKIVPGLLSDEAQAWKDRTLAQIKAKAEQDALRVSLADLTIEQLKAAQAIALDLGQEEKYAVITALLTEKTKERAGSVKELANAEEKAVSAHKARMNGYKDEIYSVTFKIFGIDTGLKQLDLWKSAISGVGDVISNVFSDMVSGTASGTDSILRNMAKMALGIVKQVAVAIMAYEAQAIALAIVSGASFNFVQAGLALAAAAAVAGIVSGLESRLGQSTGATTPAASAGGAVASTTPASTSNAQITIPTSQVTVMASPEWMGTLTRAADRMLEAADKMLETAGKGVKLDVKASVDVPRGNLAYELATGL